MSNFISHAGFNWEYLSFGEGTEILFAFHGFGNHASDFKVFKNSLGEKYKIISFNLPYHGNSTVDNSSEEKILSKNILKETIEKFLQENNANKFSVMGYSIGGKITLQLIELFPNQIESAFLFAPDGIKKSIANIFVTKTFIGRKLYQRLIPHPENFFWRLKLFLKLKIISNKLYEFILHSLSSKEKRQLVWDVWMCLREINPDIKNIQRIINENKISLKLFFGKYDTIIPVSVGEKFTEGLNDKSSQQIVETGHAMMNEKMNIYLQNILV